MNGMNSMMYMYEALKEEDRKVAEKAEEIGMKNSDQIKQWGAAEDDFRPENAEVRGMNQDLKWLAEKITEWNGSHGYIGKRDEGAYWMHVPMQRECFTQSEWQAARDELMAPEIGIVESFLGSPFSTLEEDEEWGAISARQKPCTVCGGTEGVHVFGCHELAAMNFEGAKQPRYQDAQGEDWIDEAARTFTAEEFRGAMRFSIGKYNRRMGKKDELIKEIEKIEDYAARWLAVERGR